MPQDIEIMYMEIYTKLPAFQDLRHELLQLKLYQLKNKVKYL